MELYQKLNVPELPGIQQEILEYHAYDSVDQLFDVSGLV